MFTIKKNDIIEAVIEDVMFPNKGIAVVDNKKVIIKNTIKGQKVKARITKKRRNKIEGKVLEVLERAAIEKEAKCEHFGACGGCSYQTIPYNEQLEFKANQVKRLLDDAGIKGYEFLGIEPSPNEYAYRNKMEFTFGDVEKGGDLALGLHKRGRFYEIVTVEGCQIVDEDFTLVLNTVLKYFRDKEIPFYHKKTHKGVLRHLVVRKAIKTGELLVNLVTSSQMELDLTELIEKLKTTELQGELKGFLHTINDSLADAVLSDETRILYGQDYITEEILGLKFKISAFSFFQTNSLGAEKLYSVVRDFAGTTKDKVIFDLYCGTGTIAQIMAPVAKKVIGIEIVEEAVEAAKENAKLNGLDNCDFIAGDVMEKVKELKDKPDLIILDPPRDGIHPKAINKIIDFDPPTFVYVSCKPTSLARDLPVFVERGYEVTKVKCVDMFPHTPHVETVVLIKRKHS
ncbi:23S rRNA (uracil(1939)-C(5))-methyltransferase RlmD [Caldisalinibacter kiritimatiensis]|uniref:RNA methyltransferase, TrmA family n=1 Tax=Caldisalinibacter kiritimatiensis TaxID=1304284 RepID=R1AWY9_9FIRM|nr:23S rRNA (uracil(1939)-C(5))-methyltransferase RlmD [Caldisalinibacter kiritimatiensis]EOD01172.1 RNA methyltransferase, TrmA family [Caldisalinibacter kiritimatiensis]